MKQIHQVDVCAIELHNKTITVILKTDEIVQFKYPSQKDAASDLNHWRGVHLSDPFP